MSTDRKILILSRETGILSSIGVILDFLGESHLSGAPEDWKQVCDQGLESPEELGAVILDQSVGDVYPLLDAIRQWDEGVPVIGLGELEKGDHGDGEVLDKMIIARLDPMPHYNRFMDTLYRVQVYRDQYAASRGRAVQREILLFRSLVGTSRPIQKVREMMSQVADKEVSVLIMGESGTGKEVVARNLHYNSHRREKPFVPVNCGAIPAELLESELFGHEKGAFTGAITARQGRFELAQGGTLFLDEIGDMPLHMQVKILRVLQERTFERVGSNKTLQADVRIIAATHKNLEEMIESGDFREDLYYRLNVFPIEMPPLRERSEDVPLLINELISRMEQEKRGSLRFNSAAILSLCRHEWPGNVRELANLVERLAIMNPYGVVGISELPQKFRHVEEGEEDLPEPPPAYKGEPGLVGMNQPALLPVNGLDLKEYLANLEKDLIKQALEDTDGVVARAAEKLHLRRTTLVEKVRKYGLNIDES